MTPTPAKNFSPNRKTGLRQPSRITSGFRAARRWKQKPTLRRLPRVLHETSPSKVSGTGTGSRSVTVGSSKPPASAPAAPAPGAASKAPAKTPAPAAPALTNAQVIKMAKAGVDEDNIVATIHGATAVQFDLSPDGLVDLASNGVKGKIVMAMRERARRRQRISKRRTGFSLSAFRICNNIESLI